MFRRYEQQAAAIINDIIEDMGFGRRSFDMRSIPFSGSWGTSASVSFALANEVMSREPLPTNEGLSKKEVKALQQERVREKAQEIAGRSPRGCATAAEFARVEAANGFVNMYFNTNFLANEVVRTVIEAGSDYGRGPAQTDRVMVEYSQPNTHKEFHVGHLRNAALGNALAKITAFAGYETLRATYPGDIGMHVMRCLWCLQRFHANESVAEHQRGRWLGRSTPRRCAGWSTATRWSGC